MANLFLIPRWFFGYGVAFELIFAIITLAVALYSFKVYKLSNQNQPRLFGIAFLFFSISYFIQSILNYFIISEIAQNISTVMKLQSVTWFNAIGLYVHMFFFIVGLVTLAYMTLKIKSPKTFALLIIMFLLTFFLIDDKIPLFYVMSSLLLIFISIHYLLNFVENRKPRNFLVLVAFLLLLFGNLHFIFAVNHTIYYVIGHFLDLTAYILILVNLLLILKNGKKKK
jgi:hypothetical protein